MKKQIRFMLCFAIILMLCTGCGKSAGEPETVETIPVVITEEASQVEVLHQITISWLGDEDTFTVGENLDLDEFGRIAGFNKRYDSVACAYNEAGALVEVRITDDKGSVGVETWTYAENQVTENFYDPNDGYHYVRQTTMETTTDDSGRIARIIERNTYTDPEDGAVSYGEDQYEFEYDENGRVSRVHYYIDGKKDHITVLTYDDAGNLMAYSNVGASDSEEYLRFEFAYQMVEEASVTIAEIQPFTAYSNWEYLINHIL